jgi:hypothetical protein
MDLAAVRYAIRPLLDERLPADAMAVYYAFHHDADKTFIVTSTAPAGWVDGFVTCSRTGIDLFRPLLTMRLPLEDLERSRTLLQTALPSGQEAFAAIPPAYLPLIRALCDVQTEEELAVYALPAERFKPLINVLATREDESDGSPVCGQATAQWATHGRHRRRGQLAFPPLWRNRRAHPPRIPPKGIRPWRSRHPRRIPARPRPYPPLRRQPRQHPLHPPRRKPRLCPHWHTGMDARNKDEIDMR